MLPRDPRKTRRWQRLRLAMLAHYPVCEAVGCGHVATEVHHLVPVMKDPAGFYWYDTERLRCICHDCHVATHMKELEWKPRAAQQRTV